MSGIKLPLALSLAGHAGCLVLLALFVSAKPPAVPQPIAKRGIEVIFEPAAARAEAAPTPAELPAPTAEPAPSPEPEPPLPEPPAVAAEPPPPSPPPPEPAPVAASEPVSPPPPPQKHVVRRPPKPVPHRQEAPQPAPAYLSPAPPQYPAAPVPAAPPQTAMAATPVPAPVTAEANAGYATLLSAWLNSHKRYPESARHRGEEGSAVLRFQVERSGRVVQYSVVKSSGYPDLDAAVEEMMRGAVLPPFPPAMTVPSKEYTVNIRFRLER